METKPFEELAEEAFAALPDEIVSRVDNVAFVVEEWPDPETLEAMGIPRRLELLGLYQGLPLTHRSIDHSGTLPDRVVLFQRPIEHHAAITGTTVWEVIYDTLLHEIGHHFGLGELALRRLEGRARRAGRLRSPPPRRGSPAG